MKSKRAPFTASWRTWTAAYVSLALVLTLCPPSTAQAIDESPQQVLTTETIGQDGLAQPNPEPDYSLGQNMDPTDEQPFGLVSGQDTQATEPLDTTVDPSGLQSDIPTDQPGDPLADPTDNAPIELDEPTGNPVGDIVVVEDDPIAVVENEDDLAVGVQDATVLYKGHCGKPTTAPMAKT